MDIVINSTTGCLKKSKIDDFYEQNCNIIKAGPVINLCLIYRIENIN